MPEILRAVPFDASHIPFVQHINCGPEWWCTEVAEWIRCTNPDNSAIEDMKLGVSVWLYENAAAEIVGFGSLARARWPIPDEPESLLQIIPVLGLHVAFHGHPIGAPPEHRFSNQIMTHLLDTAEQRRHISSLVALMVAPENHKAKRFYEKFGFVKYADAAEDAYERMIVEI